MVLCMHSQIKRAPEGTIDRLNIRLGHRAEPPIDHGLLDGPDDPRNQRRKEQAGLLPICDQVISEKTPPDIAGDCRHDDFLPRAVVRRLADDKSRPQLSPGLVREDKTNQHDVSSPMAGRRRRLSHCPTTPRALDPIWQSAAILPRLHRPGPDATAPRWPPACTGGASGHGLPPPGANAGARQRTRQGLFVVAALGAPRTP